ncbi:hypothetical protein OAD60_00105 [Candidatus Thioglobus sp.]|nr:hypothetical protein [Candidatus Thioglobus sp.]
MILIRNCPHENGIYTLLGGDKKQIIKSTYSTDGITRLIKEHNGYKWYFERIGFQEIKNSLLINNTESYCRSHIPFFCGDIGDPYKSISTNKKQLLKAIDAYIFIWPERNNKKHCIHGDFSIGNIIFSKINGNTPILIDWEHFNKGVAPWGFDLVNLLYEAVYFSFSKRNSLSKRDILAYVALKKYILKHMGLDNMICNVYALKEFISENVFLWDGLFEKLPVVNLSDIQCDYINKIDYKYGMNNGVIGSV